MEKEYQKRLLLLARHRLENHLLNKGWDLEELSLPEFEEERGVFVTLTKAGTLRGCIGHIQPVDTIFNSTISLVGSAAFSDDRFSPLQAEELAEVEIEISLLTKPVELLGGITEDKISQIRPFVDGVIISHDYHSATFLPQVWEKLPDKGEFMSHLCLKAGMLKYTWQHEMLSIATYQVESFAEE